MSKATEFIEDNNDVIVDAYNYSNLVKNCIQKKGNVKYLQLRFKGFRRLFMNQVRIFATNYFTSILKFVCFSINKKNQQDLYVENKGNQTLETYINNGIYLNDTQKVVIAYGIAAAIEHLHKNKIIHRNLKPANIIIDSNCQPNLSDFYFSIQTEVGLKYILKDSTPEIMAPKFIKDHKKNQKSFKLDVYSSGVLLYILVTQSNPFIGLDAEAIKSKVLNGERPQIPYDIDDEWNSMITRCWCQDPQKRPDFTEICDTIEQKFVNNKVDVYIFKKYKKLLKRNHNSKKAITSS